MILAVSTDAAPDVSVAELASLCAKRGLAGIEHALAAETDIASLFDAAMCMDDAVSITGVLSDGSHYAHELSALSRVLHAPVIVAGNASLDRRIEFTRSILAHGGDALVLATGPATSWLDAPRHDVPFAWHIDETCNDAAGDVGRIISAGATLRYVRFAGGGPETTMQEGHGIGALMTALALAGYAGPLVLVPSSPRYRIAWKTWLGRRAGTGCGTRAERENSRMPILAG